MKKIEGTWLPDNDEQFEYHLKSNPRFKGHATYQWEKIKAAMNVIPDGRFNRCIDVGAHVGLWSRVLAYKFTTVDAFEPIAELQECFKRNVEEQNVTLHPLALGNRKGFVNISPRDSDNSGSWRIDTFGVMDGIKITTLDHAFPTWIVDFIKIDTEGTEIFVLEGGSNLIMRSKPIIVVEQKPGHAEYYGKKKTDAVTLLQHWGAELLWTKSGDYCLGWK